MLVEIATAALDFLQNFKYYFLKESFNIAREYRKGRSNYQCFIFTNCLGEAKWSCETNVLKVTTKAIKNT